MSAGICISPHTVLRPEKGDQVDPGSIMKDIYRRTEVAVNPGRVCDKADTLALKALETAVTGYLDSGTHLRCTGSFPGRGTGTSRDSRQEQQ